MTLPVANNLPWVAALAAGPAVAAGVFVVSKVFEKQVDQLSSAVYQIGGTWDDPQVNFSRLFDAGAEQRALAEPAPETSDGKPAAPPLPEPDTGAEPPTGAELDTPPSLGMLSPAAAARAGI